MVAAVTTIRDAVGHIVDATAYVVVLLMSLLVAAIVFGIYKKLTDDIE